MTLEFLTSESDPLSMRISALAMGQAVKWANTGKSDVEIMVELVDAMAVSLASILIGCLADSDNPKETLEKVVVAAAERTKHLASRQIDKFEKHLKKARKQDAHRRPN
jgi:hypothetical protein